MLWSDSPQAKAPAMRSLGVPAEELLPVADSWVLASTLAMLVNPSNRVFSASSSLCSSVGGGVKTGASSLELDVLADTPALETKFIAVTRASPPAVTVPSSTVRVSDFCNDKAPTTPAVPPP